MKLDKTLYEDLLTQAKSSPRLRQAMDLRTNSEDQSQRMLNAMLPGTVEPIHRHPKSTETIVLLQGQIEECYYDSNGKETERLSFVSGEGIQIPIGQFHAAIVKEPSILLLAKNGAYAPTNPEDVIVNKI